VRWVITGGCGFIGTQLTSRLLAAGEQVVLVDNLVAGRVEDVERVIPGIQVAPYEDSPSASPLSLLRADVRDLDEIRRVFSAQDIVVHFAANTGVIPSVQDPLFDCSVNVTGTLNVLHSAKEAGCARVVFASSGAVVGDADPPIHEKMLARPVSPYGVSKLSGESYCKSYFECFGLEAVALRFGNVYGPGSIRKGSVVAKLIREALAGETWQIYGDGTQTRDFVYIDDLLEAVQKAATSSAAVGGEVFQIATSQETSVNELTELLGKVLEAHEVKSPTIIREAAREGEVLRNFSLTDKANRLLGWSAATSLEDGLQRTVEWFLTNQSGS